jgi:hypothetical protein
MGVIYGKEEPQPARYRGRGAPTKKLIHKIKGWKDESEGWVSQWESNQVKWHKLRMRIKRKKTAPFVGCSNIRMPTLDILIKKAVAGRMGVVFGVRPVVQAIPSPGTNADSARKVEKFLDHLTMDKMEKFYEKSQIAVDRSAEKGFFLLKPYWKIEITTRIEEIKEDDITLDERNAIASGLIHVGDIAAALVERLSVDMHTLVRTPNTAALAKTAQAIMEGKTKLTIELQDVIYNCPDISLVEPERLYVPPTTGYNPQEARYLIHEFYLPLGTLKQNAKHKGWDAKAVGKVDSARELDSKELDQAKDTREGIERLQSKSELVKIWECYCWYDINGDGVQEKAIITLAPDFDQLLRKISLPYDSGKFPFVKIFNELTDDRWFAHRGISELLEDVVKEIDVQHMQKIDSQTIRNTPMFAYRSGQINPNTVQFQFGQGIPVHGMQQLDDVIKGMSFTNTNAEFSYEREQMILETKANELIGQVDFGLQSMINRREPRTKGETELHWQSAQSTFTLDAELARKQFAELFTWIWDLWCQYGDEEYTFAYFGQNGYEQIKLTREELQGKYKMVIRGNDRNMNPQVRIQKAQLILESQQNPVALQLGIVTTQTLAEAYKRLYQELDIHDWESLINPQAQPVPPATQIQPKFGD